MLGAVVIVSLAAGCRQGASGPGTGGSAVDPGSGSATASAGADDVRGSIQALVQAVGDGAPLVVVMHDQAWGETRARIPQFLSPPVADMGSIAQAEDGADLVWALTRELELDQPLPRPQWEGRDASRPIVVSAYEAAVEGPPGTGSARMSVVDLAMPPLRHQVVVPAADQDALLASLEHWWSGSSRPAPALVEGLPGAVGLQVQRPRSLQTFVALVPEAEHVRMVVLHNGRGTTDPAQLRPRLDVAARAEADTPAMRHAVDDGHAVAALVRPWRLRATGVWTGLHYAGLAVDFVEGDQRSRMMAKGSAIAATVDVATPDDFAEFDDWSVALDSDDDGLRMTAVASLTPQGRELWSAFAAAPGALPPLRPDLDLSLSVAGDLAAAWQKAEIHDLQGLRPGQLAEILLDCGDWCPAFASLRWPMAAIKTVAPFAETAGFGMDAMHLVAPSVEQSRAMAIAVTGRNVPKPETLEGVLGELGAEGPVQSDVETRDGRVVVAVGKGVAPMQVFDLAGAPSTPGALASLSMRGESLGRALTQSNPVQAHLRTAGPALTLEVVVGQREFSFMPDFSDAQWASPLRSAPASKEAACLHSLAIAFNQSVGGAVAFAPSDRAAFVRKHVAGMQVWVDCASRDPKLGGTAKQLADLAAVLIARFLVTERDAQTAKAVLRERCPDGGRKGLACEDLALLDGVD